MGLHLGRSPLVLDRCGIVINNSIFVRVLKGQAGGTKLFIDYISGIDFPAVDKLELWLPGNIDKFVTLEDKLVLRQLLNGHIGQKPSGEGVDDNGLSTTRNK